MIDKLKIVFQEIGLGEDEAEVYYICLKLGPATVLQVSKKTNIIRATLYKILSRLEAKNLVSQIERDERTYYVAESPNAIIERLEDEDRKKRKSLEMANTLLPQLMTMAVKNERPHVRLYEGQKALSELWLMPTNAHGVNEILALLDFDTLVSYLPMQDMLRFRDQRVEKNIKWKILRKKEIKVATVPENDELELREKRFLPDEFELNAGFTIFNDKVVIITTLGEPFGILIESKFFANTMRSIFNTLWKSAS